MFHFLNSAELEFQVFGTRRNSEFEVLTNDTKHFNFEITFIAQRVLRKCKFRPESSYFPGSLLAAARHVG